jgi:hypothetical protein
MSDTTYQRIYKDTQKKLQAITTVHKPKVTVPALLEVLTDKEYAKYKELAASDGRADEAEKGSQK